MGVSNLAQLCLVASTALLSAQLRSAGRLSSVGAAVIALPFAASVVQAQHGHSHAGGEHHGHSHGHHSHEDEEEHHGHSHGHSHDEEEEHHGHSHGHHGHDEEEEHHGHSHEHVHVEEAAAASEEHQSHMPAAQEEADAGHRGQAHGAHGHSHGSHGHGHSHAHRVLRDDEKHVVSAMIVTTLSGLTAALGGGLVLWLGHPSPALLGHLLSFAAGIMLYISYGDLLPHAMAQMATWSAEDGPGDDPDGFWGGNTAFLLGMSFFAVVVWLVPEPAGHSHGDEGAHGAAPHAAPAASADSGSADAPASTLRKRTRSSAAAKKAEAEAPAPAAAPNGEVTLSARSRDRLAMTGIVAAIGISLHNLPEGLIVYNQSITGLCADLPADALDGSDSHGLWGQLLTLLGVPGGSLGHCFTRGVAVTLAVALHNIPEGMAVASPLYASTGSRWIAFKWCLLSALCEPLAALVFGAFFSNYLTPHLVATLNAGVAGIMVCLSFIELIPAACEHVSPKAAVLSNIAGQAVMFVSLHAMRATGMH